MNFTVSSYKNYDQNDIASFVEQMADKITELEEENENLTIRVDDMENEIQDRDATIKDLEQRIEELEKGSDI